MDLQQIATHIAKNINVNEISPDQDIIAPDILINSTIYKWIIDYTTICINMLNSNHAPLGLQDLVNIFNKDNEKLVAPNTYGKLTNDDIKNKILNNIYDLYQKFIDFGNIANDKSVHINGNINTIITVYLDSSLLFHAGQSYNDPRLINVTWNINKALDKVKYGGTLLRLKLRWNEYISILALGYPFNYQINTSLPLPLKDAYDMVLLPGKFIISGHYNRFKYMNVHINVYDAEYHQLDFSQYLTYTSDNLNMYAAPRMLSLPDNLLSSDIINTINHNIKQILLESSSVSDNELSLGWLYRFHTNIDDNISKSWDLIYNASVIEKFEKEKEIIDIFNVNLSTFGYVGLTKLDDYVVIYISETNIIKTSFILPEISDDRLEYVIPCTIYASNTYSSYYNTALRVKINNLSSNIRVKYENGYLIYEQRSPVFLVKPDYYKLTKNSIYGIPKYTTGSVSYNVLHDFFRHIDIDI